MTPGSICHTNNNITLLLTDELHEAEACAEEAVPVEGRQAEERVEERARLLQASTAPDMRQQAISTHTYTCQGWR
jgi:hypothetical protein